MSHRLRDDLPVLDRTVDGRPIVYLDSAASSLTPGRVLRAMQRYYEHSRANVHRGKHLLSEEASELFENARKRIAAFINAAPSATVLTSGTTASLNLIALGLRLKPTDVVVTTTAEHHALLLPFMGRCDLRFLDVGVDGRIDVERLLSIVDSDTRVFAFAHASNVTGAIHDVPAIARAVRAKAAQVRVIVDCAQSAAHLPIDVDALGADYIAFSGHKMLGPTGIGVLAGTAEALDELSLEVRGGGAVRLVDKNGFQPRALPHKLEPGTPNIAGAIGLAEAVALLDEIGMDAVASHGARLATLLVEELADLPGAQLLGPRQNRLPLVSLVPRSAKVSADHIAMILSDTHGIMVRSGHHCCHPYFDALGVVAAVRASAGVYTTEHEVVTFANAIRKLLSTLI